MNLPRFLERAWGWLRPVRSLLLSWADEIRRPTKPHGVVTEVRETTAGFQVQVASISSGAVPGPVDIAVTDRSRELLASARQRHVEDVLRDTAELAGQLTHHGAVEVVVLAEATQPGAPALLATGPLARKDARR
jgi:hypothetical protein